MQAYKIKDKAYVNIALIAVNVLIFLYFELIGDTEDTMFMIMHGAVYEPLVVLRGEYYRLFTSMFLHFGASHLVNNMLVLFVLGERMEQVLGHVKYLIFYIVSGIVANIISIMVHMGSAYAAVSAGASGAIFGVVGGLVYVVAVNHGRSYQPAAGVHDHPESVPWFYRVRSRQLGPHRRPVFRLHLKYLSVPEETYCQDFRYRKVETTAV